MAWRETGDKPLSEQKMAQFANPYTRRLALMGYRGGTWIM